MHALGRWRTISEARIAHDRASMYFGVSQRLQAPEASRPLGPLSPDALRQLAHEQFKATAASRFQGVYKKLGASDWYTLVRGADERLVSLGTYADEKAAAEAVDRASRFFGRPPPNFPRRKLPARSPEELRRLARVVRGHPKYDGVTRRAGAERPWFFQLKLPDGSHAEVGGYKTETLAARAYDRAVRHYRVDMPLNFPRETAKLPAADIFTLRREVQAARRRRCTSHFRGVRWRADRERWAVYIRVHGKLNFVGEFRRERDAALAYDEAARQLLGADAEGRLNFP